MSDHLDHDAVKVRPYGHHLVMDMTRDHDTYPVARLTKLEPGQYRLSFRLHTGRWDPMPVEGSIEEVARFAAQMLAPYFDTSNY